MTCVLCDRPCQPRRYPDRHAQCERAQLRKARTLRRRLDRARRLLTGVGVVERGGTYDEAARVAGCADGYTFSNMCLRHLGARPSALATERRKAAAA